MARQGPGQGRSEDGERERSENIPNRYLHGVAGYLGKNAATSESVNQIGMPEIAYIQNRITPIQCTRFLIADLQSGEQPSDRYHRDIALPTP
jgi:hypothetical protein